MGRLQRERCRHLLVVTIDTLRADRLGAYGYAGAETPAMDRLASEGVRFSHAVTPAPTTLPSHTTIFTGMTPPRHGVRDNAAGVLPEAALTLAEQFQGSGFSTGAFVSAFVLDSRWGLSQGFDVYDGTPVAPGEAPASPQESERTWRANNASGAHLDRVAAWRELVRLGPPVRSPRAVCCTGAVSLAARGGSVQR